jgi:hypothetical protein
MNEFEQILDSKEHEVADQVESIFLAVESEGGSHKYDDYIGEAQDRMKRQFAESEGKKLLEIRERYILDCEKAINDTKMTVSEPMIVDSFSLETTRYKMIGQSLESQLESLENMTNISDFEIMKGIILEQVTDTKDQAKIRAIEPPNEEKLKQNAINQLRFRTADINWIPGVDMTRMLGINRQGLNSYLLELLGISNISRFFNN